MQLHSNNLAPDGWDVGTVSDMCVDLIVSGNVRPAFHQVEQIVDDYSMELGEGRLIFSPLNSPSWGLEQESLAVLERTCLASSPFRNWIRSASTPLVSRNSLP